MKILIIGGTQFVGRQIVSDALTHGHEVHIFHRGKTNSQLFPNIRKYIGDRKYMAEIIPISEKYDQVIDTCGYHPDIVKISCNFLKDKTRQYIFISTCSVYKDLSVIGLNENSELAELDKIPLENDKITNENYGALKALCEGVVLNTFPEKKSLIVRPCIIVGPYDPTDRFNYWIKKISLSEQIEIPSDSEAFIQFIDVRALSQFILANALENHYGVFNLTGPFQSLKFLDFIKLAQDKLNSNLQLQLVDPTKNSFPMFATGEKYKGFFSFDGSKAYSVGLKKIPPEDTILKVSQFLQSLVET